MILSDLRGYLAEHRRATLSDMAIRFDAEPDALRGMLAHLIAKGRVRKGDAGGCASGCCKCAPESLEVYEWTGRS